MVVKGKYLLPRTERHDVSPDEGVLLFISDGYILYGSRLSPSQTWTIGSLDASDLEKKVYSSAYIKSQLDMKAPLEHNHDERYYTKMELQENNNLNIPVSCIIGDMRFTDFENTPDTIEEGKYVKGEKGNIFFVDFFDVATDIMSYKRLGNCPPSSFRYMLATVCPGDKPDTAIAERDIFYGKGKDISGVWGFRPLFLGCVPDDVYPVVVKEGFVLFTKDPVSYPTKRRPIFLGTVDMSEADAGIFIGTTRPLAVIDEIYPIYDERGGFAGPIVDVDTPAFLGGFGTLEEFIRMNTNVLYSERVKPTIGILPAMAKYPGVKIYEGDPIPEGKKVLVQCGNPSDVYNSIGKWFLALEGYIAIGEDVKGNLHVLKCASVERHFPHFTPPSWGEYAFIHHTYDFVIETPYPLTKIFVIPYPVRINEVWKWDEYSNSIDEAFTRNYEIIDRPIVEIFGNILEDFRNEGYKFPAYPLGDFGIKFFVPKELFGKRDIKIYMKTSSGVREGIEDIVSHVNLSYGENDIPKEMECGTSYLPSTYRGSETADVEIGAIFTSNAYLMRIIDENHPLFPFRVIRMGNVSLLKRKGNPSQNMHCKFATVRHDYRTAFLLIAL